MPGSRPPIKSGVREVLEDPFSLKKNPDRETLISSLVPETSAPLRTEAKFGRSDGSLKSFQSLATNPLDGKGIGSTANPGSWLSQARGFFRNIYRRWSQGPHGFLLMGASFLLGDAASFETSHSLDLLHALDPGWPAPKYPELEEITGPLSRVLGTSSRAVYLVLKDPKEKLWLLQENEWTPMLLGDRIELAAGAVFAVGEKPRWANRSGYRPDKTRVYRLGQGFDAAGRWQVFELAHGEDQLADFVVRHLARRFPFVSEAGLNSAVRAMVREAESLGGDAQARIEFLKENILESITAVTLGAMRLNPVPLVDFLRQVFAEFKSDTPDPASVYFLTERLLLNFFLLLNPPQQPQKILSVVKNMRSQGYSAAELARWIENFDMVPLNFLENVEHIPTLTRKIRAMGLAADRAEILIFRVLEAFEERDEVATPEATVAIAKFMAEAGWEADSAVDVAFRTRRILEEASDLAESGADAPPRWDDKIYWTYVLNHAARFAVYLKGFGIPPGKSREVVESLIGAYREDVVPTFIELMEPRYAVFFQDWDHSLSELLAEMKRYHPGKN